MTTPPALLLVGDGISDDAGVQAFRSFVRELAEGNPEFPVAGGSLEPSQPPLAEAVAKLVAEGTTRFAAVPLTLTPVAAGHVHTAQGGYTGEAPGAGDAVAAALSREEERHAGTSYTCGPALGAHPVVLSVLERRLEEALSGDADSPGPASDHDPDPSGSTSDGPSAQQPRAPRTPGDRARTTVLLVGGGSTDPYANAEVHKTARLLWEGRGYAGVEAAFVSLAAPDVASGLDRCRKLGAQKVVVLPYLLFPGSLSERVRQQSAGWAAANPQVEVHNADVMGGAEELAGLVLERYREAVENTAVRESDLQTDDGSHARAH